MTSDTPPQANLPAGASPVGAPAAHDLFDALQTGARYLGGSPQTREILRDLPLSDGKLTLEHLPDAAEKIGLSVETIPATVKKLSAPYAMPALLVPKTGKTKPVTLFKKHRRGFLARQSPDGKSFVLPTAHLAHFATACLLQPQFVLDQRAALLELPNTTAWLRVPLMQNSSVYGVSILASMCINLFAVALTFFVMAVYDRVTPNNSIESLIVLVSGISVVLVFDFIMKLLRTYVVDRAGQRFDVVVGSSIFRRLLHIKTHARPHSAGATANLVKEFDAVRDFFTSATLVTLSDLPFTLMFIGIVWIIGGPIVYVLLVAIPIVLIGCLILHFRLRPLIREHFREGAQKSAFLHEAAVGIDSIKLANAHGWARRKYESLVMSNAASAVKTRFYSQASTHFTAMCISGVTVGVVTVGALQIIKGELTVGALIASTMLSARAMAPLSQVTGLMTKWNHTRTAVKALDDLMRAETEHIEGEAKAYRHNVTGHIQLKSVTFSFAASKAKSASIPIAKPLFHDFNLTIKPGECIGILGRIGSGKTTLLSLISNLHQPQTGEVLLDGIDVRLTESADLRKHVGYVAQNGTLFYGNVRDNILLGDSWITTEEVIEVATRIGLSAMLANSPLGIFTPVGERGEFLSGGQRQAILLARAIIHKPSLLLLDEPTANMDSTTENAAISYLAEWKQQRTMIFVTHRPNLLRITDRVLVLDQGKIILDDSREKVVERLATLRKE